MYQNGVRVNEPLGDAVNWDLLPESAVHAIQLVGGSNPLFGLNALGGALSIEMKNGFNFTGHQAEVHGGNWNRLATTVESGGNDGRLGYYVNATYFEEDGWRERSPSDALNVYGSASLRDAGTSLDLAVHYGDSRLTGNGASPVGLLTLDRDAIFTAPDITENDMLMFTSTVARVQRALRADRQDFIAATRPMLSTAMPPSSVSVRWAAGASWSKDSKKTIWPSSDSTMMMSARTTSSTSPPSTNSKPPSTRSPAQTSSHSMHSMKTSSRAPAY